MAKKGDARETGRGPGKPPRDPVLWLEHGGSVDYETWREHSERVLTRLLERCDAEDAEQDAYEKKCRAADRHGLSQPPMPATMIAVLRRMSGLPQCKKDKIVADSRRRNTLVVGERMSDADVVLMLGSAALERGACCDFRTAYQLWLIFAEMLLRDADIGALIARVHPDATAARPRDLNAAGIRKQNQLLVEQLRKRARARIADFGYITP